MAGIGDSWGTREELLHPRGPDGRWIKKAGIRRGALGRILDALGKFRPRMFQSPQQSSQFLKNVSARKPGRFRGGKDYGRLLSDLGPTNEDLRDGVIDNPSTQRFVSMMDQSATELPDDVILTRYVGVEAFGFTPQTAQGTDSENNPGIRGLSGQLVADRGYSTTTIGGPRGTPAPGSVRMVIAAQRGTKVVVPGAGQNDQTVFLDRDQRLRVTKIEPDGTGGWVMYAITDSKSGRTPIPIGGPIGDGTRDTKQREAAVREAGRIQAAGEKRPDEVAEQADIEQRRVAAEEAKNAPVTLSPTQDAERRRIELLQQQAGVQPRTEPIQARSIGGEPRPETAPGGAPQTQAPGAPEATAPRRAVDLRLAVRDAGIPAPAAGPNRKRFNDAYEGVISGKKDPIDAARELDRDAADLEAAGDADADNLRQLSDVIKREYGLEQPAPAKKTAKKAAPVARTAQGLPKLTKSQMQELDEREAARKAGKAAGTEAIPTPPPVPEPAKKAAKKAAGPSMSRDQEDRVIARARQFRANPRNEEEQRIVDTADRIIATRQGTAPAAAPKKTAKAAPAAVPQPTPEADLDKMTKQELLDEANKRGVTVSKSWNKDKIKAALSDTGPAGVKRGESQHTGEKLEMLEPSAPTPIRRPENLSREDKDRRRREAEELQQREEEKFRRDLAEEADAEFEDEAQLEKAIEGQAPTDADLDKMTKQELLDEAKRLDITAPKSWNKDRIKKLIREEKFRFPEAKTPEQKRDLRRTQQRLDAEFRRREAAGEGVGPAAPDQIARDVARNPAVVRQQLIGTPAEERFRYLEDLMEPLNITDSRRLAKGLGVRGQDRQTGKPEIIAKILQHFEGADDAEAIARLEGPSAPAKKAAKAAVPGAAPGTAAGKITAGRIQPGMRVLVTQNNSGDWVPSTRKTGQTTITVDRFDRVAGRGGRARLAMVGRDDNGNEIKLLSAPAHQTFIVAPEPGAAPAKKAAKAAVPKRMTIGEARRLSAMDAIRENEVTGGESAAWENISRNVESGDWSIARARKEAKDSARHWRESATTVRRAGTTGTPEGREKAASRLERVADQYDKLAEDLTISQSVTKTDKFMDAGAPDKVQVARDRQAKIDEARSYGELGAEIHELINNEATPEAVAARIRSRGKRKGLPEDQVELLAQAAETGAKAGHFNDLEKRVGELLGGRDIQLDDRPGAVVPFNPEEHELLTRGLPEGTTHVEIVRPGGRANIDGESVRLARARVHPATPDQQRTATRATQLVPEGSVAGPRTSTPVSNAPRKREFTDAWDAADLQGEGAAGRAMKEIRDDVASGKLTPEEGIRRLESEIAFNQEDLNEVDANLRQPDLTDADRTRLQSDAAKLQNAIDSQKQASKFMRLYFKDEKQTVPEIKIELGPEEFKVLEEATPESLREAAKEMGLDPPKGETKDEILQDLVLQTARRVAEDRIPKRAPVKKAAKKAAPPAVPKERERVDARLLAEGIEGLDEDVIQRVQSYLDGEEVPGSGKNQSPGRIADWLNNTGRRLRDSAAIRYGGWDDRSNPNSSQYDPEFAEQMQRDRAREVLRAQAFEELAGRVRGIRRRSVAKKAAPATPEVAKLQDKVDDLEKRRIDDALGELTQSGANRDRADAALEGLTMSELRRLADQSGVENARTKRKLRDNILDRFVPRPEVTLDQFRDLPSREAAEELLAPLGKPELLRLARELSVPGAGSKNMTELRREIVEGTTGRRLDSIAIRGFEGARPGLGDVQGRPDLPTVAPGDRDAVAKRLGIDPRESGAQGRLLDRVVDGEITEDQARQILSTSVAEQMGATGPQQGGNVLRKPNMPLSRRASGAGIQTPGRMFSDVDSAVGEADRMLQRGDSPTAVSRFLRERAARVAKADIMEESRRFPVEIDKPTLLSIRKSNADYLRRVATHVQQEGKTSAPAKKAPAKKTVPRPDQDLGRQVQLLARGTTRAEREGTDLPSPSRTGTSPARPKGLSPHPNGPVSGERSTGTEIKNRWGAMGTGGEVEFHPDGVVGNGLRDMGDDRLMDVDGEPLSNVLGKLVTRMNHGEISMDQFIAELNRLAQRLPEGSKARQIVEQMGPTLDAPEVRLDIPGGTPEVLRKLARAMADNPLARGAVDRPGFRRDAENSELAKVMKMIEDFNAGRLAGVRFNQELTRIRSGVPHEANEGNAPILRALAEAVQEVMEILNDPERRDLLARRTAGPPPSKSTPRLTAIPGGKTGEGRSGKRPKLTVVRNDEGQFTLAWI